MATRTLPEPSETMGRKKGERKSAMVRVYVEFHAALQQAAAERQITVAEFAEQFLTPCLERAHRDHIKSEYKRLSGGSHGESGN
jgi:hypothetical protein